MQEDWNTISWNFGKVKENSVLGFSFIYYGDEQIQNVRSSCSCTAAKITTNTVKAELKTDSLASGQLEKIKTSTVAVKTDTKEYKLKLLAKIVK